MTSRDPERSICIERNISKIAGDAIYQQSLIYYRCEAVGSAILATAWLLVPQTYRKQECIDVPKGQDDKPSSTV